ncbi:MAG: hypothetical protein ACYTA5_24415 [Planctomycetota bacterium]|jgi:hypothetical protein
MQAVNIMGPELYFKSFGSTPAPLTDALLASYTITVTPIGPGQMLTFFAGADPADMFQNGYITDGGTGGGPWIIPEPACLMLLMAAAPFLRRRSY